MKQLPSRIKPARGFSHVLHILLKALLPILAYVFVQIDFVSLAIALVLLSKWRIFAVRPHYWLTNIMSNGIDILVGVSLVLFMANTSVTWWQLFWVVMYGAWLIVLKLRSDTLSVSAQAMVGQILALSAFYLKFGSLSTELLMLGTWGIAYIAARHFLGSFDESHVNMLSHIWAYFASSLAFILSHWLIFYGVMAQIVLFLSIIGYSLAALYYLNATDKLTDGIKRQLLAITSAIVIVVLVATFIDPSSSIR